MAQNIKLAVDRIFHDSAIAELRLQHNGTGDTSLTYNDILYHNIIGAHNGEYSASNLADMLFVSRPAVTQKINELERRGYLYRVQSAQDRRIYKLFIRRDGIAKDYYDVVEQTDADIEAQLAQQYSQDQIRLFCEMTEKIGRIILNETKGGQP